MGTYRLRVPASRVGYVPDAQGGLPPGPTYCTYGVHVPASGVGYVQRTVAPQALYMATATAGGERGAAEALRLWTVAPASVKEAAAAVDFAQRQWPPAAEKAARAFLAVVTANGPPPAPSAPASP